jgi:hypothetical protein
MFTTRKQTAVTTYPLSDEHVATMETRPIHIPIVKEEGDEVEVRTADDTVIRWYMNGDVIRTLSSGEQTVWYGIPTMGEIVRLGPESTCCRFYSDGRVSMSSSYNVDWFWGPPEEGTPVEGCINVIGVRHNVFECRRCNGFESD